MYSSPPPFPTPALFITIFKRTVFNEFRDNPLTQFSHNSKNSRSIHIIMLAIYTKHKEEDGLGHLYPEM
jgi:hypothetical protein